MFQSDMKSSIPDIDEQQQQMELYDDYDGDTNTKVMPFITSSINI